MFNINSGVVFVIVSTVLHTQIHWRTNHASRPELRKLRMCASQLAHIHRQVQARTDFTTHLKPIPRSQNTSNHHKMTFITTGLFTPIYLEVMRLLAANSPNLSRCHTSTGSLTPRLRRSVPLALASLATVYLKVTRLLAARDPDDPLPLCSEDEDEAGLVYRCPCCWLPTVCDHPAG